MSEDSNVIKATKENSRHILDFRFLTANPLLGIELAHGTTHCEDGEWRNMIIIDFGLFFFRVKYCHTFWK